MEAERRIVTVLFADLAGFTALAESLDAEDVRIVQDAYFDAVRETVARHRGVLEKFIGDAAVAVFGVPRTEDDDAERAVAAGLALTAAIEHLGGRLGLEADALRLRVGVNTGEAVVGAAGPDRGPVTGDTVNVAARLQAAAPPGGVLAGPETALAVGEAFELEPARLLALKGKAEPVRAAVVAGARPVRSREEAMTGLRAPLLGRDEELERLLAAVPGTAGPSLLALVVAPPGTGKTRLAEELCRRVPGSVRVLRARARPDALAPYEPVAQLVAGVVGELGGPALAAALERVLGAARATAVADELDVLLGRSRAGRHEPADRDATFAAWLDGLDALADERPDLWLVEDVHWASGDALAFFQQVPRRGGHGRLVVATARPALLDRMGHSRPADGDAAMLLELPPLSPGDAAALVRELAGGALPDELAERIAERSDGNPLFVEELLRSWVAVGLLERDGDGWRLAAPASDVSLPTTVQAVYAAQIDDLPPGARALARRAAVAGRRFPRACLEPLGVERPETALEPLLRRSLVTGPEPDPPLGHAFRFRHALLRDAGYLSLARAERAGLHLRLARWLEGLADDPGCEGLSELVGRHFAAAAESAPALLAEIEPGTTVEDASARAGDWLERAAARALELAAFETATDALRRALAHTPAERRLDRARRLRLLGEATASGASMDEGAAALEQAVEIARERFLAGSPDTRSEYAEAVVALAGVRNQQVRFAEAAALAGRAMDEIGGAADRETGRLLVARGLSVYNATDETQGPGEDCERALEIARASGDRALEVQALERLLAVRDSSAADWRALGELALAERRFEVATRALRNCAGTMLDDDPVGALPVLDEADEIAAARGLTEARAWCDYLRAEAHQLAGRWDSALECGLRAVARGEEHGYHRAVVRTWHVVLPIAAARRDRALLLRAQAWYAERADEFSRVDSFYSRVMTAANRLRFVEAGLERPFVPEPEPRLPAFDLTYGGPSWYDALVSMVEAWLAAGETRAVSSAVERFRAAQPRIGSVLGLAVADLLAARLAEHDQLAAAAADLAARALAGFRRIGAPWWQLRAIGVLERAGAADGALRAEADEIERVLGVVRAPAPEGTAASAPN